MISQGQAGTTQELHALWTHLLMCATWTGRHCVLVKPGVLKPMSHEGRMSRMPFTSFVAAQEDQSAAAAALYAAASAETPAMLQSCWKLIYMLALMKVERPLPPALQW